MRSELESLAEKWRTLREWFATHPGKYPPQYGNDAEGISRAMRMVRRMEDDIREIIPELERMAEAQGRNPAILQKIQEEPTAACEAGLWDEADTLVTSILPSGATNARASSTPSDDGWFTPAQIMEKYHIDSAKADAFKRKLFRWRDDNKDLCGKGWQEIADRRANAIGFLFKPSCIRDIIDTYSKKYPAR